MFHEMGERLLDDCVAADGELDGLQSSVDGNIIGDDGLEFLIDRLHPNETLTKLQYVS